MSDLFAEPLGATPLNAEERDGLIPTHVTMRGQLNELEAQNILSAWQWGFARRHDPVDEAFARNLHRRMYGDVWRWAGSYRDSNKNIGVDKVRIVPSLYEVLEQTRYWLGASTFHIDEIAARFHHALVSVHPFPNGNGRWSRLMADLLLHQQGAQRFTWGSSPLVDDDEVRQAYIDALRQADRHHFDPLFAFVRSGEPV